jgi:cytochrome c556
MNSKTLILLCGVALLAACKQQPQADQAKSVTPSAETRNAAAAAPLSHDQALAVMKERHEGMEKIGKATKVAGQQLKLSSPDMYAIRKSAATMAELASKVQSWFPEATVPDVAKTRAKAEIWQKPEDFALKAHDFKTAAQQFDAAAKRGDLTEVNGTFAATGKSCKACHDLYRAPEKH